MLYSRWRCTEHVAAVSHIWKYGKPKAEEHSKPEFGQFNTNYIEVEVPNANPSTGNRVLLVFL